MHGLIHQMTTACKLRCSHHLILLVMVNSFLHFFLGQMRLANFLGFASLLSLFWDVVVCSFVRNIL